jgi:hypothetical protein
MPAVPTWSLLVEETCLLRPGRGFLFSTPRLRSPEALTSRSGRRPALGARGPSQLSAGSPSSNLRARPVGSSGDQSAPRSLGDDGSWSPLASHFGGRPILEVFPAHAPACGSTLQQPQSVSTPGPHKADSGKYRLGENKPGRQSEDDRPPGGIFRIGSVGLCRDSRPMNYAEREIELDHSSGLQQSENRCSYLPCGAGGH